MNTAAMAARLAADERIEYALLFGSRARGQGRPTSDIDIALGTVSNTQFSLMELGTLAADLEQVGSAPVDLVFVHEASTMLAWRIFAEGQILFERNHRALAFDKARAMMNYLDYAPAAALMATGVLRRSADGRR